MSRSRRPILALAAALLCPAVVLAGEAEVTTPAAHVGFWGLEVSIGGACNANPTIDLGAASGPLVGIYEACLDITAEDVTVAVAGAVLWAGNSVTLGEDFLVPDGGELQIRVDTTVGGFPSILDDSPIDEAVYNASFYLDWNGMILGAGDEIEHFIGYDANGAEVFRLVLKPDGSGGVELQLAARQDGGGWVETPPGQEIPIPGGWTQVEVSWLSANGAGELRVAVAGGALTGLTGLDNDAYSIESVRWGAISGSIVASAGLLRLDAFSSWR